MKQSILFILLGILTAGGLKAQSTKNESPMSEIRNYCRKLLLSDTPYATEQSFRLTDDIKYNTDAVGYFNAITGDGSWKDIDYRSQMRSSWLPSWHLYRVMLLCRAYFKNNDPAYLKAIHSAMHFWIKNDFKCENWWQNNINVPFAYSSIILMLDSKADAEEMNFLNNTVIGRIPFQKPTGQNLIWQLDNEARVAMIRTDYEALKAIITKMQTVIQVSLKEGIQPDYSFQQHGIMMQFGNYGIHFVNSLLFWMSVTANTPLAFDPGKQQILFDYCSKGLKWTVYRGAMDLTAVGRQLRANCDIKRGQNLFDDFNLIKSLDRQNACAYELDGFHYPDAGACNFSANKSFWCSDYMVQLSKDRYMMSVKMHGSFVKRIESINAENLEGAFLNDGVTLIQRTGNEYKNIEPLWNWSMLPGTTSDTTIDATSKMATSTANHSGFVGQVSDGATGVSAMAYDRLGIKAFKSYFFINNMLVALGAGVESGNSTNLVTTVNQRYYKSNQPLTGGQNSIGQQWLWQDSTAYVSVEANHPFKTNIAYRHGNWYSLDQASGDTPVAGTVLSVYIPQAFSKKYAYIIKNGIGLNDVKNKNFRTGVTLLSNTAAVQAIRSGDLAMAVFYTSGDIMLPGKIILKTDKPCMVIYNSRSRKVWVSDPTRQWANINLTIGKNDYNITMPSGNLAGSSVKCELKK